MKTYCYILLIAFGLLFSCHPKPTIVQNEKPKLESDTIKIANDEIAYEITIIDAGFSRWFNSYARPRGFYSQNFLETRNIFWVTEWNRRALNPQQYNPNLYEIPINYTGNTNYGYEVNYMLYNYLVYFQVTNKQQLGGFIPRI
ncbi:DUF6146 family protein [Flavobacterium sp.]|uniref:DUF6146 family protein n=1 Tax=Flavobacterium sp. TaxID=239 RepID=UPI003527C9BE